MINIINEKRLTRGPSIQMCIDTSKVDLEKCAKRLSIEKSKDREI